jgi:ATP phosphoribosyltransferase regulatory subunit
VLTNDPARLTRRREMHQVGAELIGAAGSVADAEVIAMAVRCLDAAGLRDYQVDVGHSEFFQGLLDGMEMPLEAKGSVKRALGRRDFVALEALLGATPLKGAEHELLLRFPALRGGPEILDAASSLVRNHRSERALKELWRVYELLGTHGLGGSVSLDLGSIRDFDYYTGVIFEGYGPDLGHPVAQGGRYDGLLAGFGLPAPATGFVIHLDLVGELLRRGGGLELRPLDAAVAWTEPGLETALRLGAGLRAFGMRAVVDTRSRRLASARKWSSELGARHLVHSDGALVALGVGDGRVRRLPPEQVVARIAGGNSGGDR